MKKVVLITGGSRGIGRACARRFAEQGYSVAIIYSANKEAAESVKEEITSLGGECEILCCDVADHSAVCSAVREIERSLGRVSVLVANAGVSLVKQINDTVEADWDRVFDVNVKGVYNAVYAVLPNMIDKKQGRIITVGSIWGEVGASCEVAYSASKAAVIGFTRALSKELAPSGITVNCVSPGVIDTDMNKCFSLEDRACIEGDIPVGRMGSSDEVARAILFLASDGAAYITGEVLGVNGGFGK